MQPKIVLVFVTLAILCVVQGYVAQFDTDPKPKNALLGFGGNQQCVHANTTYGNRVAGDWKAYSEIFNKSSSFFHKTTVEMKYPSNGSKSYCPISMINVENLYQKCKCYKETVQIIQGGVRYGYVNLKISTETNCRNVHRVTIYTKC